MAVHIYMDSLCEAYFSATVWLQTVDLDTIIIWIILIEIVYSALRAMPPVQFSPVQQIVLVIL